MEEYITGLDIGTTKICAIMCEGLGDDELNVRGVGVVPSRGLSKGMIVNLESTVGSIRKAVNEVEKVAGVKAEKMVVGISGEHVKSINARGVTPVVDNEVKRSHIDFAIEEARKSSVPEDREIVHVIPLDYLIDDQRNIKDPVGMTARHLEVKVHFITASVNSFNNICSCVRRAGYEIEGIVPQSMASAQSVLTDDEKELGAVLVDIGGGTTDVIVVQGGEGVYSKVIPLGGDSITNDIAICLRVAKPVAEKLKKLHGGALTGAEGSDFHFQGAGGVSLRYLCEVIEARVEEILCFVHREIQKSGFMGTGARGAVLTGGTSLLSNINEKAEAILKMPVRIGRPERKLSGLERFGISPVYSTAVGLAQCGMIERQRERKSKFSPGMFDWFGKKMKNIFKDFT